MPSPPEFVIKAALEAAGWSQCQSKRGAAIWSERDHESRIHAVGFNHKPRGFPCDGSQACKATCRMEAIHAEQHALIVAGELTIGADMLHVKSVDGKLVPSGPPSCVACSKLLIPAGICRMWLYHHEDGWRDYNPFEFHRLSLENYVR